MPAETAGTVTVLRRLIGTGAVLAVIVLGLLAVAPTALAAHGRLRGQVQGANSLPVPFRVTLFQAIPGASSPRSLGSTMARRNGSFSLRYRGAIRRGVRYVIANRPGGAAEAGFRVSVSALRLAATLGDGRVPQQVTINERTTVATAFALAQFFHGGKIAGKNPGLRNAAAMTTNLVNRRNGRLARVLLSFPNGRSTTTLRTFNSLANIIAACRLPDWRCARLLHYGAAPGSRIPAPNTLRTLVSIARNPWHDVRGLIRFSHQVRQVYRPALTRKQRPPAWTLALRFEGSPPAMDGPGNIAVDARGGLWVGNNYEYNREPGKTSCFGTELFRFTPTGQTYPGSPYESGGTTGVGFGITLDKENHVWVGNFGFAGRGCKKEPPANSVSEYELDGTALSPELEYTGWAKNEKGEWRKTYRGGWEVGEISWPQATVSDQQGNIWVANCGNDSITRIEGGNPLKAANLGNAELTAGSEVGFERPFGAAVNAGGDIFVTGNSSNSLLKLSPSGKVLSLVSGGGLHLPMAAAVDQNGYVWVSNSGWVVAPCPGKRSAKEVLAGEEEGGRDVTLIKPNGQIAPGNPIKGAGLMNPWGIAIDGAGQVWVANFGGRRLSELCGTTPRNCPPGKRRVGAAISPGRRGYAFDGLTRVTGMAIDPSGNVWLANNWKNVPIQTNPGGYQIVAYLGLAAPVKTPLIGPPESP